jgi:Zn-finger nucleic acid-binding protein
LGIQLHGCGSCEGLWFDVGQLTAMEAALLKDDRLQHQQQPGLKDAVLGVFKDLVKTKPVRA